MCTDFWETRGKTKLFLFLFEIKGLKRKKNADHPLSKNDVFCHLAQKAQFPCQNGPNSAKNKLRF